MFPIWHSVRAELSWTHYRLLLRVANKEAKEFYISEVIKHCWSVRQLERQIQTFSYERYHLSGQNYGII